MATDAQFYGPNDPGRNHTRDGEACGCAAERSVPGHERATPGDRALSVALVTTLLVCASRGVWNVPGGSKAPSSLVRRIATRPAA